MRLFKIKRNIIIIIISIIIIIFYIDRNIWMPKRIINNLWEYDKGGYVGEYVSRDMYFIKNNQLKFNSGKSCKVIGCYFNTLLIYETQKKKIGVYQRFKGSKQWHK
jgi:hypothetical protein